MKGIFNKIKALKDNKKLISMLQLVLLGVVLFLAFDDGILNEIRYLLELLNVREADKAITNGFLLYKALFDASQLYTIVILTIKLLLSFITFIALIVWFFSIVEKAFIKNQQHSYSNEAITTANYEAVYIIQSKFLC
ncbi:MAG: hypothetical protein IJE91_02330 [Clostridia bacterium]|nr:hypothetical protein [Clostridia bacterium]